jgi:hypothetical protein
LVSLGCWPKYSTSICLFLPSNSGPLRTCTISNLVLGTMSAAEADGSAPGLAAAGCSTNLAITATCTVLISSENVCATALQNGQACTGAGSNRVAAVNSATSQRVVEVGITKTPSMRGGTSIAVWWDSNIGLFAADDAARMQPKGRTPPPQARINVALKSGRLTSSSRATAFILSKRKPRWLPYWPNHDRFAGHAPQTPRFVGLFDTLGAFVKSTRRRKRVDATWPGTWPLPRAC